MTTAYDKLTSESYQLQLHTAHLKSQGGLVFTHVFESPFQAQCPTQQYAKCHLHTLHCFEMDFPEPVKRLISNSPTVNNHEVQACPLLLLLF